MNEANLFTMWLDQDRPSKLTRNQIQSSFFGDMENMPLCDLIAVMYHGLDYQALMALKKLRQHFEDEMHHLEELTYPQGVEA